MTASARRRWYGLGRIALVTAVALGVSALAAQVLRAGESGAKVSFLEGKAERARSDAGPWKELKPGAAVENDDVVRTGKDSRLEVKLADSSVIRLAAESRVKLKHLDVAPAKKERKVGVKLLFGKAWATVSKVFGGDDSKFEIETENAVAGVRGTTFRINAGADNATLVRVYSGAVAVAPNPLLTLPKPSKGKGKRRQIKKPGLVSKKKWEEIVAKAMTEVKISASGDLEYAREFAAEDEAQDMWVAWNHERDKAVATE